MSSPAPRRVPRLLVGLAALAGFLLLAVLVARGWDALLDLDAYLGPGPERLTKTHAWLRHLTLGVAFAFSTWPMVAYTLLTSLLLWRGRHRRAAVWVLAVMLASSLLTMAVKALIGRHRPVWHDPVTVLHSYSFPSGHSSGIAAAALVAVTLAWGYARRPLVRRLVATAAAGLTLLVGLDRVFLGVHNPSDVLAGWLLGAGVVLVGAAAVFPVEPRALTPEPTVPSPKSHIAVVLNPVKVDDEAEFRAVVEAMAHDAGWPAVEWHLTTEEDPGASMAHAAAVGGAELVVVCGGDGTVRYVCGELAGTGIPVGVVPAGTGNLLARNLDLPLYLRAALEVCFEGQDRAMDLVRVHGDDLEESAYLVMAGMGFDAAIMEGVNESFKARFGWFAYVISALRSLMFPVVRLEISVDGQPPTRHWARTVVLGNVGYLQAGMPLIPEAAVDDGEVDVVLLYPRRFWSWVPLAVRVLTKSRRTDETLTRMRGRRVSVKAAHETPRQLDGDLVPAGKELHVECLAGRLLVRVPR